MVTGTHPEDVVLFDYVEGDLPERQRAELEVHLASCAQCAEQVARVQAGREALRAARPLEFAAHRRDAVLRELASQQRPARRTPLFTGRRLLAVLAPAAAVAAAVVAITMTGGGPNEEAAGTGAGAGVALEESAPEDARAAPAPLVAEGTAPAVARALRREWLDARVVGDHVEVRNATRAEVKQALASRRSNSLSTEDGRVEIVIVP